MTRRLDNALGLYMDGIRDGHVREAVTKYTGARYTQHSTGVADGVEGFVAFFEPFIQRTQHRDIQVRRTIEDGRHVFCHVSQDLNQGEARWVTTDLFDTDAEGKIIEHWDVISEWTAKDQVSGPGEAVDLERTDENKKLVDDFAAKVLIGGAHAAAAEFLAGDLIQHEPGLGQGAAAWLETLRAKGRKVEYRELFLLIGQGSLVTTYCKVDVGGEPHAVFDIYRLAEGKIVERWTNAEAVPEDTGNSGKF